MFKILWEYNGDMMASVVADIGVDNLNIYINSSIIKLNRTIIIPQPKNIDLVITTPVALGK